MYRAQICGHCGRNPSDSLCSACGLWICRECGAKGCALSAAAWTGRCKRCDTAYPDEQRRDVLDDGDGDVVCSRCGSRFRVRRLALLDPVVVHALTESSESCDTCGRTAAARDRDRLLVLHDRWEGRSGVQTIYHLLCVCGATLATTTTKARPPD
jgi:hypothetical protein